MDMDMIGHLAELSRLGFTDGELERFAAEMTDIIALMDEVGKYDAACDARKDNGSVFLDDLRPDEAQEPMQAEKILANAVTRDGAFVVPRVVE